jgi:hypothetical protein
MVKKGLVKIIAGLILLFGNAGVAARSVYYHYTNPIKREYRDLTSLKDFIINRPNNISSEVIKSVNTRIKELENDPKLRYNPNELDPFGYLGSGLLGVFGGSIALAGGYDLRSKSKKSSQ